MKTEQIFEANKHSDKQQDTFTDELLSEATLDNVTGGDGGTCGHWKQNPYENKNKLELMADDGSYGH